MNGEPRAWLVIEPGWEVVGPDGERLGRVDEVLGDPEKDIFNGLALSRGLLRGLRYVPAERVTEIREGEVAVDVGADEVDSLPPSPA